MIAEPICNKFCPHLATLMGVTGSLALLTRALARAADKVPALHIVQVSPRGALECPAPSPAQSEAIRDIESSVTLITELLSLLCAFIGINLTLQLIRDIWPELTVYESNFELGDEE